MTLNKQTLLLLLLIVLLTLSGCASKPTIYSDFDSRHSFAQNKTFTWVQDPPLLRAGNYIVSALAESRMTAAIRAELVNKGYTFVETIDDADLSVVYTMGARDKIEFVSSNRGFYNHRNDWGWGAYYFPYFVHFPFDRGRRYQDDLRSYTKGDIAIDIFETETMQPVWHTKASKKLSRKDLNSEAKNAEEIAMRLLQHFPLVGCVAVASEQCRPFK
ncbi:MAG: hypothetical protein ACJAQ6_002362 [Arenicella sp.]|jgi:hypothetical protein